MDMPQTVGFGALVTGSGDTNGEKLLYRDYEGLYSCDPEQGSAARIVSWNELEISGKNIVEAREMSTGKIYVWEDDCVLTQVSP